MGQDTQSQTRTCESCGHVGMGNFCAACGRPFKGTTSWIEEIPIVGEKLGFAALTLRMFRSPIEAPVALALQPSYRGHLAFLLAALGLWVGFIYLTRGSGTGASVPDGGFAEPTDVLTLVAIAITCFIAYGLFRLIAPSRQGLNPHVKLWALLSAFYFVAYVLLVIGTSFALLVVGEVWPETQGAIAAALPAAGRWALIGLSVVSLLHYAWLFGRLWTLAPWKAALALLAAWALAMVPTYWAQYAIGFGYGLFAGLSA